MKRTQTELRQRKMLRKIRQQGERINQLETAIRNAKFVPPPQEDKRRKARKAFDQMMAVAINAR